MSETTSKVSPIVAIAAVSVIVFSAVGVGVMTGIIPSSISKTEDQPPKAAAPQATAPAPAEQPKKAAAAAPRKHSEPARVAMAEPEKIAQVCTNCGSVIAVDHIKQKGEGTGLGAVGGAVVGGVLGNQVGSGRGRTAATVVGAGAGAYAGHEIEKHVKSTETFNVAVRMNDGTSRTFSYPTEPAFRAGDKVKVVEGKLVAE